MDDLSIYPADLVVPVGFRNLQGSCGYSLLDLGGIPFSFRDTSNM
jgi:hypothetical protein